MESRTERITFNQRHWETLQDILINGAREGGRFLQTLVVRDNARNLSKAEVWNEITSYFNQVDFPLL
jgi:hypothetical protein